MRCTGEDELEPISWDQWFQKFDEAGLAFLYREQKAGGDDSTFFKLVRRDCYREDEAAEEAV